MVEYLQLSYPSLVTFERISLGFEEFLTSLQLGAALSVDLVSSFIGIIAQSINTIWLYILDLAKNHDSRPELFDI